MLAESFVTLSKRTIRYIRQITKITAEKERIGVERALVIKMQADMLPHLFPAFPERQELDIYAVMTSAKEVGGDFLKNGKRNPTGFRRWVKVAQSVAF